MKIEWFHKDHGLSQAQVCQAENALIRRRS